MLIDRRATEEGARAGWSQGSLAWLLYNLHLLLGPLFLTLTPADPCSLDRLRASNTLAEGWLWLDDTLPIALLALCLLIIGALISSRLRTVARQLALTSLAATSLLNHADRIIAPFPWFLSPLARYWLVPSGLLPCGCSGLSWRQASELNLKPVSGKRL